MKPVVLHEMTTGELAQAFVENTLAQDEALLDDNLPKFTRLFEGMRVILDELKARPGDQRRALLRLYDHPRVSAGR